MAVGIMSQSLLDSETDDTGVEHIQNTNISICATSVSIHHALKSFKTSYPQKPEDVPTLSERITMMPDATDLGWENLGPKI
jgi:hypothetical protein